MASRHGVLAVCSFVQSDALLTHTIDTFASDADLYLVPVQPGVPVPEMAEPYLASRKLGLAPELFDRIKKDSPLLDQMQASPSATPVDKFKSGSAADDPCSSGNG